LTDQLISAAREHWALGNSVITLVAARENRVYRVDHPSKPVALRVHRPGYRCTAEITSELLWMEMLSENGIDAPKPIRATDGTYYLVIDGVVATVLSWLDGTPLSDISVTSEMYYELGRLLAQMHTLADAWELPSGFNRPTWDLVGDQPSWGRFWENASLTKEQARRFVKFRDRARRAIAALAPLDRGLIHADLAPENVLNNGHRLQPIDFDDGGFGFRLFDLATITHRNRRQQDGDVLSEATINGYCSERTLDRDALTLFEALRACTYVGWNITRIDEPNGRQRNTRYIAEAECAIDSLPKGWL